MKNFVIATVSMVALLCASANAQENTPEMKKIKPTAEQTTVDSGIHSVRYDQGGYNQRGYDQRVYNQGDSYPQQRPAYQDRQKSPMQKGYQGKQGYQAGQGYMPQEHMKGHMKGHMQDGQGYMPQGHMKGHMQDGHEHMPQETKEFFRKFLDEM